MDIAVRDGIVDEIVTRGADGATGGTTDGLTDRLTEGTTDRTAVTPELSDASTHDLQGLLLLCAPAEPHAHIDKALTADIIANPAGDLMGAIEAWRQHYSAPDYSQITDLEDTIQRAVQVAQLALTNGTTAIRSHANTGEPQREAVAVEALNEARRQLGDLMDIQIVALVAPSVTGRDGAYGRRQLGLALEAGADIVGGAPMLEDDPAEAVSVYMDAATDAGVPLDLHTDETLDASMLTVRELVKQVLKRDFPHPVTASHCVSLGVLEESLQRQVATEIAKAGINVVTLPQTNLFLQAREQLTSPPRGLTALAALRQAEVTVGAGGDNLQDPFNLVGRGDPLETASLLVAAGHITPAGAYEMIAEESRRVMGLPPAGAEVRFQADFLAVNAKSVREAVAGAVTHRKVFKGGNLVAEQNITSRIAPRVV